MREVLKPGLELIPGYKLIKFLGRGGFGEVWEAVAPGDIPKAIKVAPMDNPIDASNSRELEGLKKIKTIRHPYLLSIERYEVIDGYLVIVMELADMNLSERRAEYVRNGKSGIPRDELTRYMREAAEVLDVMSEQYGLQHLDVKPENLFISGSHVKVADFGLVQSRNTNMSRSTLAISPPYAAPELFDGRVEPSADQYSLAVTYQELLTGTRPFNAPDVRGLILQLVKGKPNLSALTNADRMIVSRAISREVGARYSSCREFIDQLERASRLASFPSPASLPTPIGDPAYSPTKLVSNAAPAIEVAPVTMSVRDDADVDETVPFASVATRVEEGLDNLPTVGEELSQDRVRATFVAFLPLEIFAHKLGGFVEALEANVVVCTEQRTLLRFGNRSWLKLRKGKGVFVQIDTFAKNPHSGFRVVDVCIWNSANKMSANQLSRAGILLIHCLKGYMMAVDESPIHLPPSVKELRAEIHSMVP